MFGHWVCDCRLEASTGSVDVAARPLIIVAKQDELGLIIVSSCIIEAGGQRVSVDRARSGRAGSLARHQSDAARGRCNPSPCAGNSSQTTEDRPAMQVSNLMIRLPIPHGGRRSWDRAEDSSMDAPPHRLACITLWHTGSPLAWAFTRPTF